MQRGGHNFILVDWSTVSAGPWYPAAVRNTKAVGHYMAKFIDFLVSQGTPIHHFHLIGNSLAAHAVGFAGKSVKSGKVRRITGKTSLKISLECVKYYCLTILKSLTFKTMFRVCDIVLNPFTYISLLGYDRQAMTLFVLLPKLNKRALFT